MGYSMKNELGKKVYNEALDICQNCNKKRCFHTAIEAQDCKRALAN